MYYENKPIQIYWKFYHQKKKKKKIQVSDKKFWYFSCFYEQN